MDLRALPWRGQLPITVDITVPVQPAAEAGLPVGLGEISEVGFAEPRRQRAIGAGIAQKALAIFDEQGGPARPSHDRRWPPAFHQARRPTRPYLRPYRRCCMHRYRQARRFGLNPAY